MFSRKSQLLNILPSDGCWVAGGYDLRDPPLEGLEVVTGHLLQRHAAAPRRSVTTQTF